MEPPLRKWCQLRLICVRPRRPLWIDLLDRNSELLDAVRKLGCKRLVDLVYIDIFFAQPSLCEHRGNCCNRTNSHHPWFNAYQRTLSAAVFKPSLSVGSFLTNYRGRNPLRENRPALLLCSGPRRENADSCAVTNAARVTRRGGCRTPLREDRFQARERLGSDAGAHGVVHGDHSATDLNG